MNARPVLVVGATGFLGGQFVDALRARASRYAPWSAQLRRQSTRNQGVKIAPGNADEPASPPATRPDRPALLAQELAEDRLEELAVPFVALRPGAFLNQAPRCATTRFIGADSPGSARRGPRHRCAHLGPRGIFAVSVDADLTPGSASTSAGTARWPCGTSPISPPLSSASA